MNPQAYAFHQSQSAPVKKFSHQAVIAFEVREYSPCFGGREHDRKFWRASDTLDIINEVEFSFEHLLLQKKKRSECLILSGCGDAFFNREISEKFGDFFLCHFVGVAFAMKKNVTANPIHIRLLGTDGVIFDA